MTQTTGLTAYFEGRGFKLEVLESVLTSIPRLTRHTYIVSRERFTFTDELVFGPEINLGQVMDSLVHYVEKVAHGSPSWSMPKVHL